MRADSDSLAGVRLRLRFTKPSSETRQHGTDSVLVLWGAQMPNPADTRETRAGCNLKDLKGLKRHYTFGIGAPYK